MERWCCSQANGPKADIAVNKVGPGGKWGLLASVYGHPEQHFVGAAA
jgi:hypothetical protein